MKRLPKLRLVGKGGDPTDVFDDLDRLRVDFAAPLRRSRAVETFARIPHDRALELWRRRIGSPAWMVLIELDRLVLTQRGKNPVRFWSPRLRSAGLNRIPECAPCGNSRPPAWSGLNKEAMG
jgi:hypothetical protein